MKAGKISSETLQKLRKLLEKYKFVLLAMAAGIFLLLLPTGGQRQEENTDTTGKGSTQTHFDLEELESRMEKVLSKIEGAGDVSLMLTLKSGTEQILAADTEYREDTDGFEERSTTVLISTGSGTKEPAVTLELLPTFQGALVVCEGGDDPAIRLLITQAVSALTGLGSDKITVCK